MIGTAHISEESANLVRRTIKKVQPDVVMIELDPKRIGRVAGNQTLEEAGESSIKLNYILKKSVIGQVFFNKLLSCFILSMARRTRYRQMLQTDLSVRRSACVTHL